jgi:hypothetical protein
MDHLPDNSISQLLLFLITVVSVADCIRRQRNTRSLWWRNLARAFAGAGLFCVLGLAYVVLWYRLGLRGWFPSIRGLDEPGTNEYGGTVAGLVLAEIGLLCWMFKSLHRDWRPPEPTELDRRPMGLLLLLGLGLSLWAPWLAVFALSPYLLDALGQVLLRILPLKIVAGLGLLGWIGDGGGVTCLGMPSRYTVLHGLNLLAWVILLLWLFESLWVRTMKRPSTYSALSEPTSVVISKSSSCDPPEWVD